MTPIRKTDTAISLFRLGNFKAAFRIFKTFKGVFSDSQKRAIEIAYECLTGKGSFYTSLGIDEDVIISEAKYAIVETYIIR